LATDTRHGLVAPERLKTLVSESVWERGGQLVNAGAITVQRSATKLGGTVADKGYMPLWVEVTLPVGATTVPVCKRCGPSWCLHAVALLLKAWEKADPDAPAKLPVLIPPLPPAETPAVKGSPVPVAGPMVGDWWARFLEDGPGWFQLSLGVEIDGLEVDLVPIFQAILREKSLDILRAWSLTQRPYPVKLPDGRVAGIPADRMARIVQALETVLEAKGKPRMSRIDAAFLPDLGIPETAWGRPESLDGFRRNLRDPGTARRAIGSPRHTASVPETGAWLATVPGRPGSGWRARRRHGPGEDRADLGASARREGAGKDDKSCLDRVPDKSCCQLVA
jgi:hypothetical protein